MIYAAVMGYGTVGAGVVQVLTMNRDEVKRHTGEEIAVKYVLDLRDFPGSPVEKILTHNYEDILNDPEVRIVVETMGGLRPAYDFTKRALMAGKHVCTSNKELVAEHGVELCRIAAEHQVNYLFEASCGGGIPIIRALNASLTADRIEMVEGILNGTTNYILTSMAEEGKEFDDALKEAQKMGYAELHPEADIEGWDACRKIAILSSLAYGQHISYKDVHTVGITEIDAADMTYAKAAGCKIKLIGRSCREEKGVSILVEPMMIGPENQLYSVDGVMNAVFVRGNALGDAMLYGSGAGSLPTASAVCGDVADCAKHLNKTIRTGLTEENASVLPAGNVPGRFFVRMDGDAGKAAVLAGAGGVMRLPEFPEEFAFFSEQMTEEELRPRCAAFGNVRKIIRRG